MNMREILTGVDRDKQRDASISMHVLLEVKLSYDVRTRLAKRFHSEFLAELKLVTHFSRKG